MPNKNFNKALQLITDYKGNNSYLLWLRNLIIVKDDKEKLNDFNIDFILSNIEQEPIVINKVVEVGSWWAEKKQVDWEIDFLPTKIKICNYLGSTKQNYCCTLQYRKSVAAKLCFVPKKAVLKNPFVEDYRKVNVDFDRYDRLSTTKSKERKLLPYQKDGVRFLLSRKKCILADGQGTGKTTQLSVAAVEGNFDSILIICPASLKTNWKRELLWYVPERDITIVDGILDKSKPELEEMLGYGIGKSGKKKDELLLEAKDKGKWEDNRIVIVNYDILDEFYTISRARSEKGVEKLISENPMLNYMYGKKSLLIIDEAHKLSNSTSNRYKIIDNLITRTNPHSIYLATGTPVTNMPQNLYCLLRLLREPISDNWNWFAERYCGAEKILAKGEWKRLMALFLQSKGKTRHAELTEDEWKEFHEYCDNYGKHITQMKNPTNTDELKKAIEHIYLRRVKEDVANLPKKTVHEVIRRLTPVQKDEYDKLWEEYEQKAREESPEKELNKNLLEGSVYRQYLSEQMVPHTIEMVDRFIADGSKVVIACCFDSELNGLKDYYKDKCVIYNGKCSLKQKDAAIEAFKENDDIKVFIGNIAAAGTGLTLVNANKLVFNSYSYTYADNSQMEDRIHRIGQTQPCDIYYQLFEDTHCEHMWDIVLKKQFLSDTLIVSEKISSK